MYVGNHWTDWLPGAQPRLACESDPRRERILRRIAKAYRVPVALVRGWPPVPAKPAHARRLARR